MTSTVQAVPPAPDFDPGIERIEFESDRTQEDDKRMPGDVPKPDPMVVNPTLESM